MELKTQTLFGVYAATLLLLSACGGGSTATATLPIPPIVITPTLPPDFTTIEAELNRHPVSDMAMQIGDETGVLYTYEKGTLTADTSVRLASGSKLLTGLAVWSLIETGDLSVTDKAATLIDGWSTEGGEQNVTLGQLLSFTSGYNARPQDNTCAGQISQSLRDCVLSIAANGAQTSPGDAYSYGPEHMQVAALMAKNATGVDLHVTLRENILDVVGANDSIGFPAVENIRYSANARASAAEYGLVLSNLLSGELVSDLDEFLKDRTADASVAYRPVEFERSGADWHYGFGFFIECDFVPFSADCAMQPTISSAGARGSVPWVDFEAGYWAVIIMDERGEAANSVALQQTLQPLISSILE